MNHYLYLAIFALIISIIFGVIEQGDNRRKFKHGLKIFAQFMIVSLVLGWIFYFLPWK